MWFMVKAFKLGIIHYHANFIVSFIIIILNSQRSMIFIQAIRLANINIKTIKRVISYLEELA